jgi:hypothetical protein
MPREVTIDGLIIDDRNHPKDYNGPYLFTDPSDGKAAKAAPRFPYRLTEQVTIRNLTTTSALKPRTSPSAELTTRVRIVEAK